jgi:hypothetical protein
MMRPEKGNPTMTKQFLRTVAAGTMLTVGTSTVGCGYILYPERRGIQAGTIDTATMVMDLLWLLAGVVPGVVALVVDFSSGGIYATGRRAELQLSPDGHLALKVPHAARPGRVELRLVNAAHEVVARRSALVGPGHGDGETIDLAVAAPASGPLTFEIVTDDGRIARAAVAPAGARL